MVRHDTVMESLDELRERLVRQGQDTASTLYGLQSMQGGEAVAASTAEAAGYRGVVLRLRQLVQRRLPADTTVIVVSKGDEELLKLYGRRAWHFPQEPDGGYAGYHPRSGAAAIIHLEALRALGGAYFVIPETALWWLDHYPDLRRHLAEGYRRLAHEPGTAVIYALHERPAEPQSSSLAALHDLLRECRDRFSEADPEILDWDTGLHISQLLPEHAVFTPVDHSTNLPYLDESIGIVALRSSDPATVMEAERVARLAVINFDPDANGRAARIYGGTAQSRVTWRPLATPIELSTSIIVPCFNGLGHTKVCLSTLADTLPSGQDVEVVVVDDGSFDGSAEWLDAMAQANSWLRVVHNSSNLGFVDSVNHAAELARGDLLVLLNNDTILLPGWLPALQQTFRHYRDAGAVGGKLVFPDGRLQEAGGIVFNDGTAAKFGYRDVDIAAPLYNFVRQVDYCSGALLATPRSLFNEIGGLDARYAPAYYEDTDYCFQVRERGFAVYYQPQCTIIHLEGATAGDQVAHGVKRYQLLNHDRFVERWQPWLRSQPERPSEPFDVPTMHRLATRVPQKAASA
jgi:GT2 family glycosyltransferase